MTAAYWAVGRRIVEFEQGGAERAQYGARLLERLSADLTNRFGRGFGVINLRQMRRFYSTWPPARIRQTLSVEFSQEDPDITAQTASAQSVGDLTEKGLTLPRTYSLRELAAAFPRPWSVYVQLLKVEKPEARQFYEAEA